jgi:enterochelin esterase-like enzyme
VNNQVVHRNHPKHADLTFDIMEREYREAVIPFIDSHYKTIANPHGRAISGLSMGGRHTMFVGLKSLDLFANFGVLSAGDNRPDEPDRFERFSAGVAEMAAIAKKLADKHGLKFVDLQAMFDQAVKTTPASVLTGDGVHPTLKGHELITKEWLKAFEEITAGE